mgnify:CR=1 FL=1
MLIHVRTTKGKGYKIAEDNMSKYHGVNPFCIDDGLDIDMSCAASFTGTFGHTIVEMARADDRIIAVCAAMVDGTGLSRFQKEYPQRLFDVGIAEQHAVVFSAGLARQGLRPVCVIYSTFLQRAYDAIIHDVCLQELPVLFAIDRGGLVGNDGPTHHGSFDLSYLRHIPNLIVMAPKDGNELKDMLFTALQSGRPAAVRYPRGACTIFDESRKAQVMGIGECEVVKEGGKLVLVAIGAAFQEAQNAAQQLEAEGIETALVNARFVKPLDEKLISLIQRAGKAIVVEENTVKGGFGSAVLELCQKMNIQARIELLGIPDQFITHGSQVQLRKDCGLCWENIVCIGRNMVRNVY